MSRCVGINNDRIDVVLWISRQGNGGIYQGKFPCIHDTVIVRIAEDKPGIAIWVAVVATAMHRKRNDGRRRSCIARHVHDRIHHHVRRITMLVHPIGIEGNDGYPIGRTVIAGRIIPLLIGIHHHASVTIINNHGSISQWRIISVKLSVVVLVAVQLPLHTHRSRVSTPIAAMQREDYRLSSRAGG